MFCCYYRHSDKHYKKSTHGVAIPRDEFLYQGSSSIVSIVKAEIFLRYFFVQFIQSRVFVSVAYFRQLIQPDLKSRFIVRSHLGPSIQSGFSLSARLHDPPTYRRTVTPTPPPPIGIEPTSFQNQASKIAGLWKVAGSFSMENTYSKTSTVLEFCPFNVTLVLH